MAAADDLALVLDLEPNGDRSFRSRAPGNGSPRLFGGFVVGQSLLAMGRTVEARRPHSFHAYFLRPGDPALPIDYAVEELRDGLSFSARRCEAIQNGRLIFSALASFQVAEVGLHHGSYMPDVPRPDELPDEADLLKRVGDAIPGPARRYLERPRPVELRPVDARRFLRLEQADREQGQFVWMRCRRPLPEEPLLHAAALGYMSDMTLLGAALLAHGRSVFDPDLQVASLDHAVWFHQSCRADEWLLYAQDSPGAGGGRGFARGTFFTESGRSVASVAQEGLMRPRLRP